MEPFLKDVRFAARMLLKNWGFTAAVVLTLAIGIGPGTAIFSVINFLLIRPLPVHSPSQRVVPYVQQHGDSLEPAFSVPVRPSCLRLCLSGVNDCCASSMPRATTKAMRVDPIAVLRAQ